MTVERLIDEVIEREGGYSNHPADRGGPTNFGITEQVARAFGYKGDMRNLPRGTAVDIYRRRYWSGPRFSEVSQRSLALAEELFDTGVNMGPAVAATFLQRALNIFNAEARHYPDIAPDGAIGPMTLAALDSYYQRRGKDEGGRVLLWTVRALRTGRYVALAEARASQEAFAYGWVARQVREMAA